MKAINLIDYLKRKQQIELLMQRVDSSILFYEERNNRLKKAIKEINEVLTSNQLNLFNDENKTTL